MNENDLGEMKSDVKNLVTVCTEIKTSLNRLGERTGDLEVKQKDCEKDTAVIKTDLGNVKEKVSDLQSSKKWFITAIIGGFLTMIWDFLRGK